MIDEEKNEIYVSKWTKDDLQLWHAPSTKPLVLNQTRLLEIAEQRVLSRTDGRKIECICSPHDD